MFEIIDIIERNNEIKIRWDYEDATTVRTTN
jgi:hypothetical protein